jgi:phosphopantetheine--protein transferase-like protein|tara:strand:+ start:323 stop:676 length:354 start_codon:yes stop_codon:yes gene_type:complete
MIIGHGIDMVLESRFERRRDKWAKTILSPEEKEIYDGLLDRQKCNYLAKVWVLKEAFVKARQQPIQGMREAKMFSYISPNLVPNEEMKKRLLGVNIHCSLSDFKGCVIGSVILETNT